MDRFSSWVKRSAPRKVRILGEEIELLSVNEDIESQLSELNGVLAQLNEMLAKGSDAALQTPEAISHIWSFVTVFCPDLAELDPVDIKPAVLLRVFGVTTDHLCQEIGVETPETIKALIDLDLSKFND